MAFTSAREKRLWWQAALVQLAIYASLAFVRAPSEWLRERNLLRLTIGTLFLLAVVWIVWRVTRLRPGVREIAVLAGFGLLYLFFLLDLHMVEERVHFLEYGLVGWLVYSALLVRRGNLLEAGRRLGPLTLLPALAAVVITGAAGWGDEGIQAILPDRVYELRDVGLNVVGGALAISATAARRWARSRDRRARDTAG